MVSLGLAWMPKAKSCFVGSLILGLFFGICFLFETVELNTSEKLFIGYDYGLVTPEVFLKDPISWIL
jgi:hypothetical protein